MYNLIDLTGKKIIVVGASQGIGRQTAITLSELGAELILIARNSEKLEQVREELSGNNHRCFPFDISKLDEIDSQIKTIVQVSGKLDGMVYCAGITNDRPLSLFKPEAVDQVLKTNLSGFIETVRSMTKKNRYNDGMRIVGISSTASIIGTKAHSVYAASKAGMNGAIRALAVELAEKDVCINAVAPGMIETEMYKDFLNGSGGKSGEASELLRNRQYLGIGKTTDVANAVAFLISPAARFITGITMVVDGGRTTS